LLALINDILDLVKGLAEYKPSQRVSRKAAKAQRSEPFAPLRLCVILQRGIRGMLFYFCVPKIESGKVELSLEPVVCQEVIDEVAASLRPFAEQKGIQFTVVYPPDPLVLQSDQRSLR